ncbi:hypothetical protein HG530_010263 [Fusarium avenaceum]|nr:hypothetical protein HG530_010263 [Fusarium avenaceum]
MGRQVDTPGEGTGGYQDLNLVVQEKLLSELTIRFDQTSMMQSDTEVDGLLQCIILDSRKVELQIFFVHVKESSWIVLHTTKVDEILCSQAKTPDRRESINVQLERNWTNRMLEVEETLLDSQPVAKIRRVGTSS